MVSSCNIRAIDEKFSNVVFSLGPTCNELEHSYPPTIPITGIQQNRLASRDVCQFHDCHSRDDRTYFNWLEMASIRTTIVHHQFL